MLLDPFFPYYAIMSIETGFLLIHWGVEVKYCNEIRKIQIFLESPEYQIVPNFSSEHAKL